MADRNGAFWVVTDLEGIIASVMVGYDAHRGTIFILPLHQRRRPKGLVVS